MLSMQLFNNTSPNNEIDDIQSSSSSSLSFENNDSQYQYNQLYHIQHTEVGLNHFDMDEHQNQSFNLMYSNIDWTVCNKSMAHNVPQRNVFYPQLPQSFLASSASSIEYTVSTDQPIEESYPVCWPGTLNSVQASPMIEINKQTLPEASRPQIQTEKFSSMSPDFMSGSRRQFHSLSPPNNYLNVYSQAHLFDLDQQNHGQKGESSNKYHPRFKSANARLSPYSENSKEMTYSYQQFLSPPLMSTHSIEDPALLLNTQTDDSTDINQPFLSQTIDSDNITNEIKFKYDIELHAPTAIIKKHDEQQVTYLNRGQSYLIDFRSNSSSSSETLTSTLSITFHEPNHRQMAESYWKYWISQQEEPGDARAIELDVQQTSGVRNIRLVSFDRISFDWHSRFGAKVYVRFNCLSTDFSRIKGVKGIPMRAVVETTQSYMTLPNDTSLYRGKFEKLAGNNSSYEYKEACYCKIKLFRDKGAERKNKDDKKQMGKQLEKVIASTNGNPEQHPLWSIISQTHKSTSKLIEIPNFNDEPLTNIGDINNLIIDLEPMLPPLSKRKRIESGNKNTKPNKKKTPPSTVNPKPTTLTFYVWNSDFNSTPYEVVLNTLTMYELKTKLAIALSVDLEKITEILWRRKKTSEDECDVYVLVEDTFISESISDGEMMTVNWEIKSDGDLRLILEF